MNSTYILCISFLLVLPQSTNSFYTINEVIQKIEDIALYQNDFETITKLIRVSSFFEESIDILEYVKNNVTSIRNIYNIPHLYKPIINRFKPVQVKGSLNHVYILQETVSIASALQGTMNILSHDYVLSACTKNTIQRFIDEHKRYLSFIVEQFQIVFGYQKMIDLLILL